ncbi:trigger factor [Christensenellaceae bacterium OttesenSCG-928-M15]|nr:trigger factor [Christensenellaceae bacterium OttesenSCG-928-M15]
MATVEKLKNSRVKLTIEVSSDKFEEAMQQAYLKTRSRYNVPGFRKGKAPRKMIENMYGEGAFYEDAFDIVYGPAIDEALEEHKIDAIDRPDIEIEKIGGGDPLVFHAQIDVQPEVSLGEYKGIEVVKRAYTVEDAQVDAQIEQEREKVARYVDQDRPVEDGDQVILDYSGSVGGEKFDGGTAENQTLKIGSKSFIPGFEEQIVGMQKDEEKDITVTFPEEYHAKELAGKEAVFAVKIHAVQVKELPELDDEFAQDVSEFETLEALKADKRKTLVEQAEERAKAEMEDEALKKIVNGATIELPESMITSQIDYMMRDIQYRLSMSGLSLEQYLQFTGTSLDKMREDNRETAIVRLKTQLVLDAITSAESIDASDEEIEEEIKEYCKRNEMEPEEFKKSFKESDKEYFKERTKVEKTLKLIMDGVKYVDAPVEAEPEDKAEEGTQEGTKS